MGPATEELIGFMDAVEPWDYDSSALEPVWIAAINERLDECRGNVKVLDRILEATGIEEIKTLDDVVPLLFPHSVYKSYPETFVKRGQWPRMSQWLDTLSKYRVEGISHEGIEDVDGWMARLHENDHFVFATSGTTGKHSYLNMSKRDTEVISLSQFPRSVTAEPEHAVFVCGPRYAPSKAAMYFRAFADRFGHPDKTFFLSDVAMRMSDLSKQAELRRAMAKGTATPGDIARAENEAREKAEQAVIDERNMAESLMAHRSDPVMLIGLLPAVWRVVQQARELGMPEGGLHPDSYVSLGGGTKGTDIPADYRAVLRRQLGADVQLRYGFQETNGGARLLEDGRYHFPAWKIPILLDESGSARLPMADGTATGRMGAFDVSVDGRWGGVITGDKVTAHCRPGSGFAVDADIERYGAGAGGDDKLTCSGTFDAFVRGFVS